MLSLYILITYLLRDAIKTCFFGCVCWNLASLCASSHVWVQMDECNSLYSFENFQAFACFKFVFEKQQPTSNDQINMIQEILQNFYK